jgi:hypothetical protein
MVFSVNLISVTVVSRGPLPESLDSLHPCTMRSASSADGRHARIMDVVYPKNVLAGLADFGEALVVIGGVEQKAISIGPSAAANRRRYACADSRRQIPLH